MGGGWVEATNRQVVRTSGNTVYIVVSDENSCNSTRFVSGGVIWAYKGIGAQAANPNIPTGFSEVDFSHHPVSAGTGSCIYTGGTNNLLFAPDIKLDNSGIIHLAYIDPNATSNGKVYHQTFDTNTDRWGARVQVATGAKRTSAVAGHVEVTPYWLLMQPVFPSSCSLVEGRQTLCGGSLGRLPVGLLGPPRLRYPVPFGTNQFQPSMVTALDGTIQLAWCDNCTRHHPNIKYAKFASGAWGAVETVSAGDTNVLGDANHDQGPAIATDLNSRPQVLYLDGTASGSDNYVRMRYRAPTVFGSTTLRQVQRELATPMAPGIATHQRIMFP